VGLLRKVSRPGPLPGRMSWGGCSWVERRQLAAHVIRVSTVCGGSFGGRCGWELQGWVGGLGALLGPEGMGVSLLLLRLV
jgi:hypothetical protein